MLFEVTALGEGGRERLRLDAADAADAAEQARLQGLTVLGVRAGSGLPGLSLRRSVRFPLTLFSRELLALLGSGLSLIESLQTLAEKESRSENRRVLEELLKHLYEGESFSSAIGRNPGAFPPLYVATVRAAERTSDLPQALTRYVAYQEQVEQVRKKAIASAVYPAMLILVGALVSLFLLGYVTPRFASIYADNMERLPWPSRLLMEMGGLIQAHGLEAALFAVAALVAAIAFVVRPASRAALGRLAWRLPLLGERLRIFQLTRFYRTVGMLLAGGITVTTALEMASGLLNPELRQRLAAAGRDIREGKATSAAMERAGLTTPVASRMLRVGEKSGRMGEMMESIAAFHDEETNRFVEWFTRLFEPLLMAAIGLIIGLIVVLLYLPIFELAGSLG
jgi:general secretion pathway protein F